MRRFPVSQVATIASLAVVLSACGDDAAELELAESPVLEEIVEGDSAPGAPSQMESQGALLDPDQATREELLAVPGIDEAAADAILENRPYEDMRAVDQVLSEHLDETEREAAYARLWKPLDLNTASAEEILLIPGVGDRMQHEFEEYRPYREMTQFRDEIGKYVDAQEVARLEQYVTIR